MKTDHSNIKPFYMGKKIVTVTDGPIPIGFTKCGCLRCMSFSDLRLTFEDGTFEDFCSDCSFDILHGMETKTEFIERRLKEEEEKTRRLKEEYEPIYGFYAPGMEES